jgi:post-segregation antitoxin (ccd killing protein)
MSAESIPPEIAEWIKTRQDAIGKALRRSRYDQNQGDPKRWCLDLLEEMATIENAARRAVHLLTLYAAREQVARPTEVAVATSVTVSSAMSRAGSKLAQEVWREVYPEGGPKS